MITVTSHALVRWMERRLAVDIEAIRSSRLAELRHTLGQDAPRAIGDADVIEFIESVGFRLDSMRARIRALAEPAIAAGASCVIFPAGVLVLDGSTVVTVLAPGMRPRVGSQRIADGGEAA